MATTTPADAGLQAIPLQEKERKRPGPAPGNGGRPTKPIAPPPSADSGSFWQWIAAIPKDDWQNLICYVWRTAPLVDLSGAGKPITIDKIAQPFDAEYMLKTHGSGSYRFDVCYSKPDGKDQTRIRQSFETIINLQYPPRVALGDWIDDPRNKNWEWARPELQADQAARAAKANPAPVPQSEAEKFSELMGVFQQFMPKSGENQALLLELMKQNDPAKMLEMAKSLAELRQPPAAPVQDNSALLMLLMKHLLEKQNPAPVDPLETASNLLKGVKGLMEGMSAGVATPAPKLDTGALIVQQTGDILGKAIEQFGPYVPAMIDLVRHVKDRDLQIAQVAAARGMNPARPWEFQGTAANPPTQAQPAPITAPAPTPAPQNQPMTPQVFFAKHQALLGEVFPILKDKFDNESGYDLADWIIDRKGRDAYNTLRKDANVELLMQIAGAVPQLNAIFQPADEARAFFEDFLCDPDNRPEEEPEAQPEGAPVQ